MQALRRAWIASNGLENLESACYYALRACWERPYPRELCEVSEHGREKPVRRLSLVYRLFLSFEKGIKFPSLQLPWDGNYEFSRDFVWIFGQSDQFFFTIEWQKGVNCLDHFGYKGFVIEQWTLLWDMHDNYFFCKVGK